MKRASMIMLSLALLFTFTMLQAGPDVKYQSETTVKFGGALGGIVKFFGGSKPQTSTMYLKGNRLRTDTADRSEIIDLDRGAFITLDHKKKEYTVLTFEEMRRQMEEAVRKAQEEAKKEQPKGAPPSAHVKFNVSVKETGRTQVIEGHDAREVALTMTIEGEDTTGAKGGLVTRSNIWVAKTVKGYTEAQDFYRRFAEKLGGEWLGSAASMMQAAFQTNPHMSEAMKELQKEARKLEGTPLLTETVMDIVSTPPPGAGTTEAQKPAEEEEQKGMEKPSIGGIFGKLAKKKAEERQKAQEEKKAQQGGVSRSNLMTTTTKLTGFSMDALSADLFQVPASYKQKKIE